MPSRSRLLALVLCLALLAGPLAALPALADCGLNDNGFEGKFSDRSGGGHVMVSKGWDWWFQDGPGQDDGLNWRPTYRQETASYAGGTRVHAGSFSQKWGTSWATHNAGVLQRVAVPRGSQVTFTAWARVWSSQGDNIDNVKDPGNYRVCVGIDPTGGTNWAAGTVRWSEMRGEYLTWLQLSISAKAEADAVTVFLRGQCDYPVKHNESYWDDTCLSVTAPTAVPTRIPPTKAPTATPTETATPTTTPSPTPAVADVCVQSYNDANGNGARDQGEALIGGADVALLDAQGNTVGSGLTAGGDAPFCVKSVGAGSYTLRSKEPSGYEPGPEGERSIDVVGGDPLVVELGYRAIPTATPVPPTLTPVPSPTPLGGSGIGAVLGRGLYGISGLLLVLVALALPFGLRRLQGTRWR